MAFRTHRPVRTLVVLAREKLGMTQKEFGEALNASHRTASRWDAGQSSPYTPQLRKLPAMVYARDAQLADELAAAVGETLESLGVVAPSPPPPPPPAPLPPLPSRLLVDSVVCAAADVLEVAPITLRSALLAAFRRARELRLGVDDVETALAPEETAPAPGGTAPVGKATRSRTKAKA
jgi:transcriptional regulator with XRE-family HTH domain